MTNTKIHHSMLCSRTGAVVEMLAPEPTGQCRVVDQCQECGGTDMADRLTRQTSDATASETREGEQR